MILTVTPNTALDRVLFLGELARNRRNQAGEVVEAMGGKGCNAALVLRELGEEAVATGLAGGEAGRRMEGLLRRGRVTPDFVWTGGETRVNTVLIETRNGGHTTVCAGGLTPGPDAPSALCTWIERWSSAADAVVIAGSLPEGWPPEHYGALVRAATRAGRPVVVDAAGAALTAALGAGPLTAIKPNQEELEGLAGPAPTLAGRLAAVRELLHRGTQRVLASFGPEGALLASERGAWWADGLPVPVVNPAGAGDGMTACLALAAARGWDEPETLRWAIAVSAAIVTTRGTAEIRPEDAVAHMDSVRVHWVA